VQMFDHEHLKTSVAFCAATNPRFNPQIWLDYITNQQKKS